MENLMLIIIGLVALALAIFIIMCVFAGAVDLFQHASELGCIGIAIYFTCWIFFFPFMLVFCIISGVARIWFE